jgi:hypothetical protein
MTTRITGWPFPAVTDAYRNGNKRFFEIDEAVFEEQFGALPPKRLEFDGIITIFLCSEEYNYSYEEGCPLHSIYIRIGNRCFTRLVPIKNSNRFYLTELTKQIAE